MIQVNQLAYQDGSITIRHLETAKLLAEEGESAFTVILLMTNAIYESYVSRKSLMHLRFLIMDQQQELREKILTQKRI